MKPKLPVFSEQTPLLQSPFAKVGITGSPVEDKLPSLEEPLAKICGRLILKKEKAHRSGKTVLIVTSFSPKISKEVINCLAKEAKIACGCGGTVMDREITLQGDQPDRVRKFFESKGFRVDGVR